jgi:peroxiredoxin Q/BCP
MLKVGDTAPDFEAPSVGGKYLRLRDYRGRRHVVLYFFPRDFTPGCTKEACSFRDHRAEVARLDGEIIGVSLDPVERHEEFAKKYRLTFPLVSDADGHIAKKYGVARLGGWLPTKRVTFVIDKDGTIQEVIHSEFGIDVHIDRALETLRRLQGEQKS